MYHLWNRVLGLVAQRVNNDAAAHRTIRTGAPSLAGSRNFQVLGLCVNGGEIETECGEARSTKNGAFEKRPAGEFHQNLQQLPNAFDCAADPGQLGCKTEVESCGRRTASHRRPSRIQTDA